MMPLRQSTSKTPTRKSIDTPRNLFTRYALRHDWSNDIPNLLEKMMTPLAAFGLGTIVGLVVGIIGMIVWMYRAMKGGD